MPERIQLPPGVWMYNGHGITSVAYPSGSNPIFGGAVFQALAFEDNAQQRAVTVFRVPAEWKGGRVRASLLCGHTAGAAGEVVVWEATLSRVVPAPSTGLVATLRNIVTATAEFVLPGQNELTLHAATLPAGVLIPGDAVHLRLVRDAIDARNTLNQNLYFVGGDLEFLDAA